MIINKTKAILLILFIMIIFTFGGCDNTAINVDSYPDTPKEVWGDLESHEGGRVWDTLTKEQQALVQYPKFDENKVYWVSNGKSYHAIDWCYTLEKSNNIKSGTLKEANQAGKTDPCSKCVGH